MSIAVLPMSQQYGWDSQTIGLVQSSFFWCGPLPPYGPTQIEAGTRTTRCAGIEQAARQRVRQDGHSATVPSHGIRVDSPESEGVQGCSAADLKHRNFLNGMVPGSSW